MFDGNNSRRRLFDNTNNGEQNSTGYREKTVFPTEFGAPENNNYQNGFSQPTAQQNYGYDGDALNPTQANGYASQPALQQSYGYAAPQSATPVATAQTSGLPMVFASRKHKDVYVYEYNDRLEWYLKTATCMHLFNIDRKQ